MGELARVRSHMRDLGFSFSTWDAAGQLVGAYEDSSDLCALVCRSGGRCLEEARQLAQRVIAAGQPIRCNGVCGCALMAIPVHQRRRLLGAIVAGFPPRQMNSEETLCAIAARHHLDADLVRRAAATSCRHSSDESAAYLKIITWMLEQEHSVEVASHEISTLSSNLATTYEELSLVYRISGDMKVTQQPGDFLQTICNELAEVMNIEAATAVIHANAAGSEDDFLIIAGDADLSVSQIRMLAAVHASPMLLAGKGPVIENHFRPGPGGQFAGTVRNLIVAPLAADKTNYGLMIGLNKRCGDFDSVDMKLINSIANQASVFLANNRLFADLQDLLMGVLHALTSSIDAKDPYTCGHSQRVALLSRRLAQECGFGDEKVQQLYLMGLLHDVGKIGVPESVLCKPGRLTDDEFEMIKRHPSVGAKILGGIRQLDDIVVGIVAHHERLDGRGYPRGLKGDEVPFEGLIVGLADCFDAMTTNRTYRNALPLETVVQEITKCAGTQFHPMLVQKFLAMDMQKLMAELHAPARTVFPVIPNRGAGANA